MVNVNIRWVWGSLCFNYTKAHVLRVLTFKFNNDFFLVCFYKLFQKTTPFGNKPHITL